MRRYRALDGYGTAPARDGVPTPALSRWRICERCDARWAGDAGCWNCGQPGDPMDAEDRQQGGQP